MVKKFIKRVFHAAGFELRSTKEVPPYTPEIRHAEIFPSATYSPWLSDQEFTRVFEMIRQNTLVDRYRCYELWQLVADVAKLPAGELIEIGVWRGGTGALIAKKVQLLGIREQMYLCDTFFRSCQGRLARRSLLRWRARRHLQVFCARTTRQAESGSRYRPRRRFPGGFGRFSERPPFRFCHVDVDVF